jgi:hypothetical protein
MAFDKEAFMKDILTGVSVESDQKAAIEAALENPIIAKRIEEATLRQSDYSRKLDEYNKKAVEQQKYHSYLVDWQRQEQERIDAEMAKIKKLANDEGVNLDNSSDQNKNYLSKDEFQKAAQEYVAYANTSATLQAKHLKEFGEILNLQEVVELATKEGTNVNIAYERLVQPRREEVRKAEFEKQLEAARKQGAEEAVKNFKIPTADASLNNGVPHALDGLNRKADAQYGADAAVKAWQEQQAKGFQPLF